VCDHDDMIIVGSGAGGGTLAHRLAPSRKRVLVSTHCAGGDHPLKRRG